MEPLVTFHPNNPSVVCWSQWIPLNGKTMESHCGHMPQCQNTNYPSPLAASVLKVHPKLTSPCAHLNYKPSQWIKDQKSNLLHVYMASNLLLKMPAWLFIMRLLSGLGMTPAKTHYRCCFCLWGPWDILAKTLFTPSFLLKLGCQVFKVTSSPRWQNRSGVWRHGICYFLLFCWNGFLP